MSKWVLQTNHLSKKYKDDFVVDHVNMSIKKGEIYGFIGQNGAGKTTFIRMILGLTYPTKGNVELFEQSSNTDLIHSHKRIGAIVESPALFPNMTAYENVEVHRLQKGVPGKECVHQVLAVVGLRNTNRKKVKDFSLGMKQRLGLAIALLGDPEFLILDEPTNGLDPVGIIEIRELLKHLNQEKGITILISSHLLGELHQLATYYGIIHNGRLLEQITAQELNEKCKQHFHIKVDDIHKATTVIETKLGTTNFEIMPDTSIKLYEYLDQPRKISSILSENGLIVEQFMQLGEDLESYFTSLIGGTSK
jgi:ABC-2 type transport system ATP-binding protein